MSDDGGTPVRGGSFYDAPGVFETYREHRHGGTSSANIVMEEPAVLAELGSLAGKRVLDLGCGDATFGRTALATGARSYLGVDGSNAMVGRARDVLAGTGGAVVLGDLEDFDAEPGAFDVVVSRMALHYLADLGPTLAACRRSLAPGGQLLVTVVHPVITARQAQVAPGLRTSWLVDDFFVPGPRERAWMGSTVTWHHRTTEDYVREIAAAGFRLTGLRECEPVPARFDGDAAELARRRRVPVFLLLAAARD
ncbi:class I SAM-dependent methyltransferase [Pengzhenrongella sp.]|jgi:SAM-dependent methyltransferase|uniref:class I SAM-dependent methyltransferase n=1 Tax=Pengzhenrongella sp. TaxID=2888820 RepID=UPI002F95F0EC